MSQVRVLLVDDDELFSRMLADCLRGWGFDTDTSLVQQPIIDACTGPFPYDIVLLDVRCPARRDTRDEYPPVTLVEQLKERHSGVEVIVITGKEMSVRDGLDFLRAGAYRYMAKPLNATELQVTIRAAIEYRNLRQRAQTYVREELVPVLFLASNPTDSSVLRLGAEIKAIDSVLLQSRFGGCFDLRQQWAVRPEDLQAFLLRYEPRIVHFSGHGSASGELILEDTIGRQSAVPVQTLAEVFSVLGGTVECVVLNACYSELQARAIVDHVGCVIGMSNAITEAAAIGFAAGFYQALGYGRDVKTAFDLGCTRIDLARLGEEDAPKLLSRNRDPREIRFVTR